MRSLARHENERKTKKERTWALRPGVVSTRSSSISLFGERLVCVVESERDIIRKGPGFFAQVTRNREWPFLCIAKKEIDVFVVVVGGGRS